MFCSGAKTTQTTPLGAVIRFRHLVLCAVEMIRKVSVKRERYWLHKGLLLWREFKRKPVWLWICRDITAYTLQSYRSFASFNRTQNTMHPMLNEPRLVIRMKFNYVLFIGSEINQSLVNIAGHKFTRIGGRWWRCVGSNESEEAKENDRYSCKRSGNMGFMLNNRGGGEKLWQKQSKILAQMYN